MKPRVYVISLIISLIAPLLVTFTVLHVKKRQVRKEVKHQIIAGLDRSELVKLSFAKDELYQLRWEHSKEFEFNHQMYDVVELEETSDSVHYWCWWDSKESFLEQKLDNLLSIVLGENQERKGKEHRLMSFYNTLYYESIQEIRVLESLDVEGETTYLCNYINKEFQPLTPPPLV